MGTASGQVNPLKQDTIAMAGIAVLSFLPSAEHRTERLRLGLVVCSQCQGNRASTDVLEG